jgi:hypothetical protein
LRFRRREAGETFLQWLPNDRLTTQFFGPEFDRNFDAEVEMIPPGREAAIIVA